MTARLAQALEMTEHSAAKLLGVSESLASALNLFLEAFDGVTQSEAEDAITDLRIADALLTDVLSLLARGDESVRQYAAQVLQVRLADGGGAPRGGIVSRAADFRGDDFTYPSRKPDPMARPRGQPARWGSQDDVDTARGRQRENEAAETLARLGYDVEQNPVVPGSKNPDYRVEGKIFDAFSPDTGRVRNIWGKIEKKILKKQTRRVILNLDDSEATIDELRDQFDNWPIGRLLEVLVVRDGKVTRLVP